MISSSIKCILLTLERWDNWPSIVQRVGIALLTILVPVAIVILAGAYQKNEKQEFRNLDLNVILDRVFKVKRLLLCIALIFLPMIVWEISSGSLRFIVIILSIVGVIFVVSRLFDIYYWIKGNVFKFRFSYLENLRNHRDMETVWYSVWQTKNVNPQNEIGFFTAFSSAIDRLLGREKNLKTVAKLLYDFDNFIDNRSIITLVLLKDVFPKILTWHLKVWKKEYEYINQDEKLDEWEVYSEISGILDSIIRKIEECALKERHSFSFFKYFEKHAESHKTEFVLVNDEKRYYIDALLSIFYQVFFEKVSASPECYAIWQHYFPPEWKVTRGNWQDSENVFVKMSWNEFIKCLGERVWRPETNFDRELDDISSNLFPEVEPSIWAIILIFVFSPYGKERMEAVIQRPWNFGLVGRAKVYSGHAGESEEDFEKRSRQMVHAQYELEKKNAFELTTLLFPQEFSKENLEKNIRNLKALKYGKESKEEKKRLRLLSIFTEMLEFLKQQQNNSKE